MPVFNRGQKLQLTYLCTVPSSDEPPAVFVATLLKGVKLKYQVASNLFLGVPVNVTGARGLLISVLVVVACGLFLSNVWVAAAASMTVGLIARLFGALEYKVERLVRDLIAG